MSRRRFFLVAIVALWIAAVLQTAVVPHISFLGFSPDLYLVMVGCLSVFSGRAEGALVGFLAGLLQGGLHVMRLAHYIVSRTLTGFLVAWSMKLEIELRPLIVAVIVVLATILAKLLWMFLAAPPGIGAFLADTIRTAVYNGVLAVPVYALLKRILNPDARKGI